MGSNGVEIVALLHCGVSATIARLRGRSHSDFESFFTFRGSRRVVWVTCAAVAVVELRVTIASATLDCAGGRHNAGKTFTICKDLDSPPVQLA
jgi:hypothetical protein